VKTIGMIGGMSWESSSVYYQLLNREIQKRLGGIHSARALLHSFDFAEIAGLQDAGRWDKAAARMTAAGQGLAKSGADFLIICCNTMHRMADAVEQASGIPLLHIADPLGAAIRTAGMTRIGLLGSRHTMNDDSIIKGRLKRAYDLELLIPEGADFAEVDRIIYEELTRGQFRDASRAACRSAIGRLVARGAEAVILGCTELPLLVKPEDSAVPLFDTTTLHAMAAVEMALA
jgi:aspartate racemase